MRKRSGIPAVMALAVGLAAGAGAQEAKTTTAGAPNVAALYRAMDPGEEQKRLEFLVGTFDVKIRTWVDTAQPPVESAGVAVCKWVLNSRYIQTMLSGFAAGEPFNAIGYAGYDNVAKTFVATYMDSGSTGIDLYRGALAPDGKSAKLTATVHDAITLEPVKAEMRLGIAPGGDHTTEVWQEDRSGKMVKVLELQYTRRKS